MKAYVLHGIGDLRYEEILTPAIEAGETLVEVKAAGICGSDIPRIFLNGTYHFPTIPGHEFSGIVRKAGTDVDNAWIGKRVGIYPLISCGKCGPCQKKFYEMCRNYNYLGSRTDGGFAEYVAVPTRNLIELPDNVSFEAAAMLEPMAVGAHAIRGIIPRKKDTISVCGLGTIGILLTMFLKEMGSSNLLVIGNKNFQKQMVQKLGVLDDNYCDSRIENIADWILRKTDGVGVDIAFECVGKNTTIKDAITYAAPGGKIQLVGNPSSDITFDKDTYWRILRNQLTVKGSWNSSYTREAKDDWHYVLNRLASGVIHPEKYITHKFPFNELEKGLEIMRDKTEEYVKVIITR